MDILLGNSQAPMYDPNMVQPMRDELTALGVQELRTPDEVDAAMAQSGSALVFVNSVCGCAAGGARPALRLALQNEVLPQKIYSVFAGQDKDATEKARSYFLGCPPSSPSVALMQDGQLVGFLPRHHIEGRPPEIIADALKDAFNQLYATQG